MGIWYKGWNGDDEKLSGSSTSLLISVYASRGRGRKENLIKLFPFDLIFPTLAEILRRSLNGVRERVKLPVNSDDLKTIRNGFYILKMYA